jgi:dipeptidyl aminopeptidase/acylaminoacyl peptidase
MDTLTRSPSRRPALRRIAGPFTLAALAAGAVSFAAASSTGAARAVTATSTATAPATVKQQTPIANFYKRPKMSSLVLSPNGRYIAAVVPLGERRNLAVLDLDTRKAWPVTNQSRQDIGSFSWANDDRLLVSLDNDGNESSGLFAVNRDGTKPEMLIEPAEAQMRAGSATLLTADVISPMESDPERVLVSVSRITEDGVVQDVETLNIYTGKRLRKIKNPGDIQGWIADREGFVFGAVRVEGVKTSYLFRDSEDQEFQEYSSTRTGEAGWSPAYVSHDRKKWYVSSRIDGAGKVRDKAALFRFDPATRKIGELVYEHPEVDVGGVIASRVRDDIVGFGSNADKPVQQFTDPTLANLQSALQKRFPDHTVSLTSASRDEKRMLFSVWSSTDLGRVFLYDRDRNGFEELANTMSWLRSDELSPQRPVRITARDGLVLPAYLTVPRSSAGKNLPFVLMPHGGPRARDFYGYDPLVQILASRGYAVLQVNFRGSVGFGLAFDKAGWLEWGGKMQDDLVDGVKWAVAQGIADPQRMCIFGASYGGYATMMGLAQTPELFRCGINYVGVTDLPLLLKTIPRAWEPLREDLHMQIGNAKTDLAMLEARSPTRLAAQIKAPVLMAYGARDPRVVLEHGKRMEKALKDNGVPVEFIVKTNEGHGYRKFENQVEFAEKVVAFLDRHIGAGATPAVAPAATAAGAP